MSTKLFIVEQSSPTNRQLITGLALAGFASGTLSIVSLEPLSNVPRLQEMRLVLYVPGAIFGVMVAAYYAIFMRARSSTRLLSFIVAAIAAYFLAVTLSVYAVVSLRSFDWSKETLFYGAMFVGGLIGSLILLIAAQLLLSRHRKWRAILSAAILWSLAGGFLGVVGFALGGSLGKLLWLGLYAMNLTFTDTDIDMAVRTQTVNVFSLFVVWQTCLAPILGWLVSKSSAVQPEQQSAASSA